MHTRSGPTIPKKSQVALRIKNRYGWGETEESYEHTETRGIASPKPSSVYTALFLHTN